MAATKSKLNAKLPNASKIAFCSAAGKDMSQTLYTGENGKFSRKVGFKQNKKTYPWQIQYRTRSKYTDSNAAKKGAKWTKWSAWKNAVAVSGIAADATTNPNTWMKANKGINKKSTYATFKTFTNYKIPDDYTARQFQYRIRSFNKAKARHGNWNTQTLKVIKRAAIADEVAAIRKDGGISLHFNYKWDGNLPIYINSIKDANGRELLRKKFHTSIKNVTWKSTTTPSPRSGYQGGKVEIPLSKLKRQLENNEDLTVNIYARTDDGAKTPFVIKEAVELSASIPITMSQSWDDVRGVLTVVLNNTDDDDGIDSMGCACKYTYNGKTYSVPAIKTTKDKSHQKYTFTFYPPIGLKCTLTGKASDVYDRSGKVTGTGTYTAKGYRLNPIEDTSRCGIAWGNTTFNVVTQPVYETSVPFGREKNVIFYGDGATTTISFTATIIDKDNVYGGEYQRKRAWDWIRSNQGIYYFRSPKGDMYRVGLTDVEFSKDTPDLYQITAQMVEVV